jgi:hypothetical protein
MEEEYSTTITFDDNPTIIEIEKKLEDEKANLWWSREELRKFKSDRREAVDQMFKNAVKNYQNSLYRNAMRDMRREMINYRRLSEGEKNNIRNDFIQAISRQAYDDAEMDFNQFQNSEYFKEYERSRRRGGRKRSITRRKKRTKRRTKRRTRK